MFAYNYLLRNVLNSYEDLMNNTTTLNLVGAGIPPFVRLPRAGARGYNLTPLRGYNITPI